MLETLLAAPSSDVEMLPPPVEELESELEGYDSPSHFIPVAGKKRYRGDSGLSSEE